MNIKHVVFIHLSISILLKLVGAQPGSQIPPPPNQPFPTFTPSLAIIISILIAALVFMLFFSIYVRHCAGDTSAPGVRRGISLRNRRVVAARGIDASVIEAFPTFSYSEVKDRRIGYNEDALECAVCLNEFEDEETLLLIPKCDHVFHPECIGAWLVAHVTCPVCRADLVPIPGEEPVPVSTPVLDAANDEIVIRMEADESDRARVMDRNMSLENANRTQRSWSMKMFGFEKYRSRSSGHSLVRPGENIDRFTLKLPVQVRNEMLNRTGSRASLQREGSLRSRNGRSFCRFDREGKSDRWVFFGPGSSMKSPKSAVEIEQESSHGGSSSSRRPVKMPSFRCLEPKAANETGLAMQDQLARNSD